MNKPRQPLLLRLEFAFEIEHAGYALKPVERSIYRDFWKCSHGKRSVVFVIVTQESSRELVTRLKLDEVTALEDYCCHVAPIGAISKHGGMSTLHDALQKAWAAVGERRSSAYRDQRKRFNPRTEARSDDREYGALRERKPNSKKSFIA
jgi:hypothetical protein